MTVLLIIAGLWLASYWFLLRYALIEHSDNFLVFEVIFPAFLITILGPIGLLVSVVGWSGSEEGDVVREAFFIPPPKDKDHMRFKMFLSKIALVKDKSHDSISYK